MKKAIGLWIDHRETVIVILTGLLAWFVRDAVINLTRVNGEKSHAPNR